MQSGDVPDQAPARDTRAVAKRLRAARERAGFESAGDFAREYNINATTYYHHENGRRAINASAAQTYARILKLPAGTLLYGERLQSREQVPIVGEIIVGGKLMPSPLGSAKNRFVELPSGADLVAHVVVGDDLYPAYRDGDIVYHRALRASDFNLAAVHGLECVVELEDGRLLLRQIAVQADEKVTLFAYHATPMTGLRIRAAAPIELVQRRLGLIAAA